MANSNFVPAGQKGEDGGEAVFIDNIRRTGEAERTQMREALCEEAIDRYAEAMGRHERFPLADLVDAGGGAFLIADGWHRVAAAERLGRQTVFAIVHPVPDGESALDHAVKLALHANNKHGLHLTRGDQKKKAKSALLHPSYTGWTLRALEAEIGVGKSTLGRVRADLVREGLLDHPTLEERMPEWMPSSHASGFRLNEVFRDEHQMEYVYEFIRRLDAQVDPRDWEWDLAAEEVTHYGLLPDKTLRFSLDGNSVVNGLPVEYHEASPTDDAGATRGDAWANLSREERDRITAAQALRDLHKAVERIKQRKDKELTRAVNTLLKRSQEPDLWPDILSLVQSGGPSEEHLWMDF